MTGARIPAPSPAAGADVSRGAVSTTEERRALDLVGQEVLHDEAGGTFDEPVTVHHGLPSFDALAVVDHTNGTPVVVAAGGPDLRAAVRVEALVGQGPATEAVLSREMIVCRDLERERRWPDFRATALERGLSLRRWVSVPLAVPGETAVGALVVAATTPGIVTPEQLATVAALADRCSLQLTAAVGAGREARAVLALDTVRLVGVAVGAVMATEEVSEAEALRRLRARGRRSGHRLVDVAAEVVAEHDPEAVDGPRTT